MEFLKTCSTNLQAVEGYSSIDYQIYQQNDSQDTQKSQWDDEEQRYHVLLGLRQRGVLVQSAVVQKKVCVFGGFAQAEGHMKELGWQLSQRGRLETAALTRQVGDPKTIVQNQHISTMFLSAIEASLSMALAASCGAVRVGHLAWIIPAESEYHMLTLRAQMTSQGTLVLLPHAVSTGLSLAAEKNGSPVVLAPSGTPATVTTSLSSLSLNNDDAPPRQARREARIRLNRRAKDDSWKSSANRRLQHSSLPHDSSWMRVSLRSSKSSHQVSCLWPDSLCLTLASPQPTPCFDQVDSMFWFDSQHPYQNPLKSAESWFLGQAERDGMEQKSIRAGKEKEKEKEKDKEKEQERDHDLAALTEETTTDQPALASPVYSRSLQDQISINGIYPTPPDGMPPPACTEPHTNGVMAVDGLPGIPENDPQERRSSNVSDLAMDTDHFQKGSTDDLFGDMDEEMFGAPDLTDADFSFFDNADAPAPVPAASLSEDQIQSKHDPAPKPTFDPEPVFDEPSTSPNLDSVNHEDIAESPDRMPGITETKIEDSNSTGRPKTPPLSPFQIRERLLPSPVPANTSKPLNASFASRRDSNFVPVIFKSDVGNFDAKYRAHGKFNSGISKDTRDTSDSKNSTSARSNSIALPQKRPRPHPHKSLSIRRATFAASKSTHVEETTPHMDSDVYTSQDSDSDSSSPGSTNLPQLDIKKRKRPSADDGAAAQTNRLVEPVVESDVESVLSEGSAVAEPGPILDQLLAPRDTQSRFMEQQHRFSDKPSAWKPSLTALTISQNLNVWPIFDFGADDLVNIAQLVAEQSIFTESPMYDTSRTLTAASPVYLTAQDALKQLFSTASECDFSKLGGFVATHAEQTMAAATRNQPRPAPRRPGTTTSSNGLFGISPPAIHVRRAGVEWEMQPTALHFWESLSLEPANGPKDVVAFALFPESGLLSEAVADFLQDVRSAYQNCKFGSHELGNAISETQNGLMPFRPHGEPSAENVLQGLHSTCMTLGDLLHDSDVDTDKTIIIYIVNPFQEISMVKYLCGCFQALYRAYYSGDDFETSDLPDVVLQLVPINRIASPTSMVIPDIAWLSSTAGQVYDKISPRQSGDAKSSWLIDSAPNIQLASAASRKINFTLTDHMPRNLLEEAHILHVSYAINADNTWLSAAWTDNTGKRQCTSSYCLSNANGKTVLCEVRDTTLNLARNGTWRIFVGRAGTMRDWEKRVWREHQAENWAITLLDVDTAPMLSICCNPDSGAAQGFMTPAATPQNVSTFASPETQGAPSTPASELPAVQEAPTDPDAFLIDTTDETWGIILPFSATRSSAPTRPLASGILVKRGDNSCSTLPALGIDVLDVVAPKINEGQTSWLQQRAPETILRECMVWYRGLGLLARVRGVGGAKSGVTPWHVAVSGRACESLTGFLE